MDNINSLEKSIQSGSPNGEFLQSEEWRKFQEAVERKTFNISIPHPNSLPKGEGDFEFRANVIEHQLPVVGKYFYVPRGPVIQSSAFPFSDKSGNFLKPSFFYNSFSELIELARKNNAGWIRIEPENEEILDLIKKSTDYKIAKAPHDMQPKEILVMDITKSEEELLAGMKQKTRYNIRLAEKKGIIIKIISNSSNYLISNKIPNSKFQIPNQIQNPNDKNCKFYVDKFIELVKITAKRDRIAPHPENYYRKMFEVIPGDILKLCVAEYQNKVIAANLMILYGKTATYLHGASDNKFRNVMAPYLLQWQAIKNAKAAGYEKYDFGGIHTKTGEGITRFKTGFALNANPVEFPGSYDIILNKSKYFIYKFLQSFRKMVS